MQRLALHSNKIHCTAKKASGFKKKVQPGTFLGLFPSRSASTGPRKAVAIMVARPEAGVGAPPRTHRFHHATPQNLTRLWS